MLEQILKEKTFILIKHFDEQCSHWVDWTHYRKLEERQPDLAQNYADLMFDIEVIIPIDKDDRFSFFVKCAGCNASMPLYRCENKFEKTIAHVNKKIKALPDHSLVSSLFSVFEI